MEAKGREYVAVGNAQIEEEEVGERLNLTRIEDAVPVVVSRSWKWECAD